MASESEAISSRVAETEDPELYQYYYHADHLGSSSYITNLYGEVAQHVEYIPFGEVFIEERNNTWNTPYLFNGKELDEETGLYYYGARYYNPRVSQWLSVDPLALKYPNISPYVYVANNPINAIDPDGRDIIFLEGFNPQVRAKIILELSRITGLKLFVNLEGKLDYLRGENDSHKVASKTARGLLLTAIESETRHFEMTSIENHKDGSFAEEKIIRGMGRDNEGKVLQDITYQVNIDPIQVKAFIDGTSEGLNDWTLGFGMTTLHEYSHKINNLRDPQETNIFGNIGPNSTYMNIIREEIDNSGVFKKPFAKRLSYYPSSLYDIKTGKGISTFPFEESTLNDTSSEGLKIEVKE